MEKKIMGKDKLMSIVLMVVFITSINGQVSTLSAQDQFIETNFDIWYYTQAGSRTTESYALYTKQALAPLGIEVKIIAKPWGQFVGDLLHKTTGHPFDITHIRFTGGAPTPGFMWKFHSTKTSFGQTMYQLDSIDFQEWQEMDAGVTTQEVDQMLEKIEYERDLAIRKELITEFNELYMTRLLYDFPVVALTFLTAMWKGYGGENNELWNADEGIIDSRKLGAKWTEFTPNERVSNNTHMRLSTVPPELEEMFDPNQSFDSATSDITRYMHNSLLDFDSNYTAHPGIAWNYYYDFIPDKTYDHDDNSTTPEVGIYQYTWFLGNKTYWSSTTDTDGNYVAAEVVDAQDFVLAYDMFKHPETKVNGKEIFDTVLNYTASTTIFSNDTFTININANHLTPDDYINFGSVSPVPHHILGGNLTLNTTHSAFVNDFVNWNPQESEEWKHWASYLGHSLAGAFDIVEYFEGELYSYAARDDYWYPNEDDIAKYYDSEIFTTLEEQHGFKFDIFDPNTNDINPQAIYWAFDDNISSQGIESFEYVIIDDINAVLLAFDAGNIDSFVSTSVGAQIVENHQNNENLVIKEQFLPRGPELLVFNLLNDHLKKINVRLAIVYAIDRDEIIKIHDGFAKPQYSIVWPGLEDWIVPYEIIYDYNTSRDLMRYEGYQALQNPEFVNEYPYGGPHQSPDMFNPSLLLLIAGVVIIAISIFGIPKYKK
jgi:hypothetical protein